MALPPAAPERQLMHSRRIDVRVYARGHGLWEVDAEVSDIKTHDTPLGSSVRPAGQPIHDMLLRLVIDERFNVLEAGSLTRAMPYAGVCDEHGDVYQRLVGLNLLQGFRHAVRERVGAIEGCTHLTELTAVLPTAVMQAFGGTVFDSQRRDGDTQPAHLNRCHALRTSGDVVRLHYPRWYRPSVADASLSSAAEPSSLSRPR